MVTSFIQHHLIVQAIDRLAVKMHAATKDGAETTCTAVSLRVFGDGSYAVEYEWRANTRKTEDTTREEHGARNLAATLSMDTRTVEIYDTLQILIDFFRCQGVWISNGD